MYIQWAHFVYDPSTFNYHWDINLSHRIPLHDTTRLSAMVKVRKSAFTPKSVTVSDGRLPIRDAPEPEVYRIAARTNSPSINCTEEYVLLDTQRSCSEPVLHKQYRQRDGSSTKPAPALRILSNYLIYCL